jgi:AcrR family transcriptional regulator
MAAGDRAKDVAPRGRAAATEQRRREILAAALSAFLDKGYAATTLADIRERSGASTGSIYHLFASKEEIAGAVYVEGTAGYQDGFTSVVTCASGPEQAVRGSVQYHLAWVEENRPLARFLATTRQTELLPGVRDRLREMNRAFFRALQAGFAPWVEAGLVRPVPWELFVAIVAGPAHEHARAWLGGRSRISPREAAPVLADAAWAAIRGEPKSRRRGA